VKILAAVSAGGVVGALARYGISVAWPAEKMWATLVINVTGCFLIGLLYERPHRKWWVRPFLGVGVLGGYTTFSTSMVETLRAEPEWALLYLGGTLIGAMLAVWAGSALARTR
jgi:CrcB protein